MTEPTAAKRLDEAWARIHDPKLEGAKVYRTLYGASARQEA